MSYLHVHPTPFYGSEDETPMWRKLPAETSHECCQTHEAFVHSVRRIAAERVPEPERSKLLNAKLVYGIGTGAYRGVCYFGAWENGSTHDFIEIAATGEESNVQLAGTTIHETAHVLAGPCGHGAEWKAACARLGLIVAEAAGQQYAPEHFAPDVWAEVERLSLPDDGKPKFAVGGLGPFVGLPTPKVRPCPMGYGTRGGKRTRSGGRLRKFTCGCGVIARVCADTFDATCNTCGNKFAPDGITKQTPAPGVAMPT